MSTEVALKNIEDFRLMKPSAAFASLNPQEESLSDGIGSSYGVIGYKGKVWTLRYRGEQHMFVRADDGTQIGYIDVVILRQGREKSKSYYPDGFDPQQSAGKPPTCSSMDGKVPDPGVPVKQADACVLCPRNIWKTMPNGKKGRECTDYKRTAVLVMPKQTMKFFNNVPLMEPCFLRIPPASLQDLATFGDTLQDANWHYSAVVTRISFDPNEPHPKMMFRPIQPLTDAEAAVVLPIRDDEMTKRIVGEIGTNRPALTAPLVETTTVDTGLTAAVAAAATGQQSQQGHQQVTAGPQTLDLPHTVTVSQAAPVAPQTHAPPAMVNYTLASGQTIQVTPEQLVALEAIAQKAQLQLSLSAPVVEKTKADPEPEMDLAAAMAAAKANPIVTKTVTPPATGPVIGQTAEDIGDVGEPNADLDARIAALVGA